MITVFQDENTILLFKEIETFLVAKHDLKMFWQGFFKNINECQGALQTEQLVRRWVLAYVCGEHKKLSKTLRLTLQTEKAKVSEYILNRLDIRDALPESAE